MMQEHVNRWTSEIDQLVATFIDEFGGLSEDQLNWKPDAKSWSIAQNIDHLITINQSYFPAIDAVRQGTHSTPLHGRIPFLAKLLGNTILAAVHPDRRKKMKTFPLWEPNQSRVAGTILDDFERHQAELKAVIETMHPYLNGKTVIASPASKMIVYTLDTAFDIIVTHERRHLEQAREVLRQLDMVNQQP
jgi:hypothetical protein